MGESSSLEMGSARALWIGHFLPWRPGINRATLLKVLSKEENEKDMPFRNEKTKPRETADHYKPRRRTPPESPVLEVSLCETDPSNRQLANHDW